MRDLTVKLGVTGAGAIIGFLAAVWSYYEAQAAVKVRPELANVGFVDALLTSHGVDWLFYHAPATMMFVFVVIGGLIGTVVWWSA